jgi:hypothetical protein
MSKRSSTCYHGASANNSPNCSNGPSGTQLNPAAVDRMSGSPLALWHWWDA